MMKEWMRGRKLVMLLMRWKCNRMRNLGEKIAGLM